MQERNIVNGVTATSLITVFWDFYRPLLPFLILAVALVLADLNFGISAAKKRMREAIKAGKIYEPVRFSRAGRRTINKLTDYICWVTLAGLFGQAFGQILGIPALAAIILLVIYVLELSSCFSNYFEARGIKKRVNLWKFFSKKLDIIEVEEDKGNNDDEQGTKEQ